MISGLVIEFKWCINGIDEIRTSAHFHIKLLCHRTYTIHGTLDCLQCKRNKQTMNTCYWADSLILEWIHNARWRRLFRFIFSFKEQVEMDKWFQIGLISKRFIGFVINLYKIGQLTAFFFEKLIRSNWRALQMLNIQLLMVLSSREWTHSVGKNCANRICYMTWRFVPLFYVSINYLLTNEWTIVGWIQFVYYI